MNRDCHERVADNGRTWSIHDAGSHLRVISELQNAHPGNFGYTTVVCHKGTAAGCYRCSELQRVGSFDSGRGA